MSPDPAPSRLDPEAQPRRDFLGAAATGLACGTCAFAVLGASRLPKAAVLPSASKKFKVVLPDSLPPGEPYFVPGRAVAIFRKGGQVWALSTLCPHLGCVVKPSEPGFDCPCHGSQFARDGSLLRGPSPKGLPWLSVQSAGGGAVVVDQGTVVPAGRTATL
jgi:cytochrome b6-f complex iron-sulfur subunit